MSSGKGSTAIMHGVIGTYNITLIFDYELKILLILINQPSHLRFF